MPFLLELRELVVAGLTVAVTLLAAGHAVLYKRDVRAAIGWTGLILVLPFVGAVLYWFFGINRLARRAMALRTGLMPYRRAVDEPVVSLRELDPRLTVASQLDRLAGFVGRSVDDPLMAHNRVVPLDGGGVAYRAMLAAIDAAERTVALATYIFDNDPVGRRFRDALVAAHERGVEVRVLIDAVGERYSWPSMARSLRRRGVPAATFLGTRLPWWWPYFNLRNHRKLLIVDGIVAFTGGMNIRRGHVLEDDPPNPVQDLHFQVEGPIVSTLREVFAEDWTFITREVLTGDRWFPALEPRGDVIARGIVDGPDENFDNLRWTLLGALACAQSSVRIVTPYFLPGLGLTSALATAARRGVRVEILVPRKNNLRLVQWASTATLWQVLEAGCEVYLTPPPFDHSKLFVVDGGWALIGSANWDVRSLRLNFELDVECYSEALATELGALIDAKKDAAQKISLEDVDARPIPVRLRDGLARLLTPYL